MLIYVHGFNSSPASTKARQLKARLESVGRGSEFSCPALPDRPVEAVAMLEREMARARGQRHYAGRQFPGRLLLHMAG